jgi:hypothetical protein
MDEHDPRWVAPADEWEEIPSPLWAVVGGVAMALLLALLAGCDSAELDRLEAAAEHRDRFYRGCMPRKGDTVTAQWVDGELICKRITPTGRYGRTFPHVEVKIATIEGL